jgi:hypothetical protein
MGDADYVYAFQKVVMPIAMEFAPELVISINLPTFCSTTKAEYHS